MTRRVPGDYEDVFGEIFDRLKTLETTAPVGFTSITRGALRIASDEGLIVQGSAIVTGIFRAVGQIILESLGILKVIGLMELTGSLRVKSGGDVVVEGGKIKAGNVEVRDGKIYAGSMVIDPDDHGGSVKFPNGAQVFTDGGSVQLFLGNSVVQVTDGYARLQNGGNVVEINGSGIRMSPGAIPSVTGTGLPSGTLIIGTDGYLKRAA